MWTLFWDMHSGGGTKEPPYQKIYIEAPQAEAEVIFYNRFGHSPNRVTCTCCGEDYSVGESKTLEAASGFHRGCAYAYVLPDGTEKTDEDWRALDTDGRRKLNRYGTYVERPGSGKMYDYQTLEQYLKHEDVLVIRAADIKPEERVGRVPEQGYVWVD